MVHALNQTLQGTIVMGKTFNMRQTDQLMIKI